MAPSPVQAPPGPSGAHLVLYDGVCGLCNGLLQFLLRHDHRRVFSFASLQSPAGQSLVRQGGGNPSELSSFYVIADYRTGAPRVLTRSDASLFVAGALGWPWRAALVMRVLPRAVRNRAYDVIARNRYRVFGRYDHCLVPDPGVRDRFIDSGW